MNGEWSVCGACDLTEPEEQLSEPLVGAKLVACGVAGSGE